MKRTLIALILAPLAAASWAQSPEATALRVECASKYQSSIEPAQAAAEYQFVYRKGEYRGEKQAGKTIGCTEKQYNAYLASVDPTRVMNAYPTAAGRPASIKPNIKPNLADQVEKK
ncbi:hypothetical protein [Paucibacter sp. DJ2R-2]|uniref:hypothetical protein n=1 Tax=Paucibacter sp. DJ2R-2 TaxID=2893558 RepID=UPI0021E3E8C2|nr:hypothetical protein [Paucibacter sp. DJ2R-2]MCV2420121.1 hypothetical protein [Paucibacter sp. DJ4R-1]MCV2436952.1 hypothetical protein [Paucibacter sp. DJ2R-2]